MQTEQKLNAVSSTPVFDKAGKAVPFTAYAFLTPAFNNFIEFLFRVDFISVSIELNQILCRG